MLRSVRESGNTSPAARTVGPHSAVGRRSGAGFRTCRGPELPVLFCEFTSVKFPFGLATAKKWYEPGARSTPWMFLVGTFLVTVNACVAPAARLLLVTSSM